MFPVGARLGKDYTKGAKQFMEQIKTSIFVPDYRFMAVSLREEAFDI